MSTTASKPRDYSSADKKQSEKITLTVRPGCKYGEAVGGERVLIDREEYTRGPTRETLWTDAESAAHAKGRAEKAAAAKKPPPHPVRDAIHAQLAALTDRALGKTG